ncbi:metal-dependent transcriptional regulator [Xanthomarina sp. F1114]|uniref:metal-dependent transcriptional regulator n=1 Tax=Xanthomarina sp. F1114 TaxID=2996019 RepID=UPI00225E1088|nr:metal-dependent transcriptional regulator [Xanthomarina sp. F1114]MCX7548972.1 metal-dependent transcriptional regulator [Xanthomarina sp. F1114]
MITLTEENYIKAIYHLSKHGKEMVSTNALAEAMRTKASSATDMVKKLAEKNYVDYKKYQGAILTESGSTIAINVIRKHRLWEVFLVDKLHFSWDEVHELAEQLEHIKSQKLIDKLDAFLGHPTHDPHGDPIPDKHGDFTFIDKIMLAQAQVNETYNCVGVNDSSSKFLQYLNNNKIELGTKIEVLHKEAFDSSIKIKVNGLEMVVSNSVAQNLYIQKV